MATTSESTPLPFPYPDVKRSDHVDVLHGKEIADPYRYLEDPDSPETQEFVTRQNQCTTHVFESIPYQEELTARFTELYNYEKWSCPRKVGNAYFFYVRVFYCNKTLMENPHLENPHLEKQWTTKPVCVVHARKGRFNGRLGIARSKYFSRRWNGGFECHFLFRSPCRSRSAVFCPRYFSWWIRLAVSPVDDHFQ